MTKTCTTERCHGKDAERNAYGGRDNEHHTDWSVVEGKRHCRESLECREGQHRDAYGDTYVAQDTHMNIEVESQPCVQEETYARLPASLER